MKIKAFSLKLSLIPFFLLFVYISSGFAARGVQVVSIKDKAGNLVGLYKESHALVIGVSDYTGGWPRLRGVRDDIKAVVSILEKNGFHVVLVEDPDQLTLESAFENFVLQYGLDPENRLLFYFAGHGYTHKPSYAADDPEEWMGYLVSRNAPLPRGNKAKFFRHAMSMQRIEEVALKIESKHALFLFDSCFSGSIFALSRAIPGDIQERTAKPVRQFISSGSADQEVPDVSIFRRQFVSALEGEADKNNDGYVTGSELGLFIEETVTNLSRRTQTPQYGKIRHRRLNKGDFVFSLPSSTGGRRRDAIEVKKARKSGPKLDPEEEMWKIVKDSTDVNDFGMFLEEFPNGPFRAHAKLKLSQLKKKQMKMASLKPQRPALEKIPAPAKGMVFIKGGCFRMGDTFGEGSSDEKPVHEVCVDNFYLGEHEVTQGEWKDVMGNNPSSFKNCGKDCPVESVSWDDTQEFIRKLNRKTGKKYRLPTEAEWEYAAREKGKRVRYGGGFSNENDLQRYANLCDVNCEYDWKAKDQDDGFKETSPVRSYKPNSLGLYDMSGNVWEWVSDWYGEKYYRNSSRNNPKGPGSGVYRSFRGGSWIDDPKNLRAANRDGYEPDIRNYNNGFRLAQDPVK